MLLASIDGERWEIADLALCPWKPLRTVTGVKGGREVSLKGMDGSRL